MSRWCPWWKKPRVEQDLNEDVSSLDADVSYPNTENNDEVNYEEIRLAEKFNGFLDKTEENMEEFVDDVKDTTNNNVNYFVQELKHDVEEADEKVNEFVEEVKEDVEDLDNFITEFVEDVHEDVHEEVEELDKATTEFVEDVHEDVEELDKATTEYFDNIHQETENFVDNVLSNGYEIALEKELEQKEMKDKVYFKEESFDSLNVKPTTPYTSYPNIEDNNNNSHSFSNLENTERKCEICGKPILYSKFDKVTCLRCDECYLKYIN